MGGFSRYIDTLRDVTAAAIVTDRVGSLLNTEAAIGEMGRTMRAAHQAGNKIMFVGNGGGFA